MALSDEVTKIFLNTKGKIDDVDADMKEFLTYVENTTDAFAEQSSNPLIKEIHKRVTEVKQSKEMEVEYMTLLQRDRENLEQGREDMAVLTERLLEQSRTDDLKRALKDVDFRNELFEEFGIV